MIPDFLYQYIYLIVILILTVFVCERYRDVPLDTVEIRYPKTEIIFLLLLVVIIGYRPLTRVFVDSMWYVEVFPYYHMKDFAFSWNTNNLIFDNFQAYLFSKGASVNFFFFIIAAIYFGLMYLACRKMFPQHSYLAFLVYLGAFSTFSYGTNGIKAGAAASAFLIAIAYRENRWLSVMFLLLSIGLHHSMMAPIAVYIIASIAKKPNYFLYLWIVTLIIAAFHITFFQELFAGITDEQGAGYLIVKQGERAVSGFRPDFILYSAVPIFIGYHIMNQCDEDNEEFNFIWNVYTGTNAIFLLCTYGSYINRIAYLSWLLYPIVLIYPFINVNWNDKQYYYLRYVVYGHLGFTLFMNFIYY